MLELPIVKERGEFYAVSHPKTISGRTVRTWTRIEVRCPVREGDTLRPGFRDWNLVMHGLEVVGVARLVGKVEERTC
jgi:hypothetical protein